MTALVTSNTIPCINGKCIIKITLNKPNALNALCLDMIRWLQPRLEEWILQPEVIALFIEGAGERAFCAGGDLHQMYSEMVTLPKQECPFVESFFQEEYRLDYTLHNYPKPIIAWGHGVCMGGGIGIFRAADYRIVTESSRLAMPEITIGLFPDVGASYFLNQLPEQFGRFLAITGAMINSADAIFLGLANASLPNREKPNLLKLFQSQSWSNSAIENQQRIGALLDDFSKPHKNIFPPSKLPAMENRINRILQASDTLTAINAILDEKCSDPWFNQAKSSLKHGSPLSVFITDKQIKRSMNSDLKTSFQEELMISTNIVRFSELTEGIRALLIDKDKSPRWHFNNFSEVNQTHIETFFHPPWKINPLFDL